MKRALVQRLSSTWGIENVSFPSIFINTLTTISGRLDRSIVVDRLHLHPAPALVANAVL